MPMNNIIENVIAGLIVAAVVWGSARAWSRLHRKEPTDQASRTPRDERSGVTAGRVRRTRSVLPTPGERPRVAVMSVRGGHDRESGDGHIVPADAESVTTEKRVSATDVDDSQTTGASRMGRRLPGRRDSTD
jgi:hypothetical protein